MLEDTLYIVNYLNIKVGLTEGFGDLTAIPFRVNHSRSVILFRVGYNEWSKPFGLTLLETLQKALC